jgi:mono/diheme cytochrome c family protein
MAETTKPTRRIRKILFVLALLLICVAIGLAAFGHRRWAIPAENKEMKNPLTATQDNLNAAKEIYGDKCANCHGDSGKGDGSDAMMYDPAPTDLTDASKINSHSDGELFYQITKGRKPMPSYEKKLTDTQRWQLVLYVRSLAAHK